MSKLGSNIHLDLVLQSDNIVFHGKENEATSKLLLGKVILRVEKRVGISSLTVVASGKTQFGFKYESQGLLVEAKSYRNLYDSRKEKVLDKTETLLDGTKKIYLEPNTYEYQFAIRLSGDLPETLNTTHGKTEYSIKAVLKGSYLSSITKEMPIYISRAPNGKLSFGDGINQNQIEKKFSQGLEVNLNIPSRYYSENQTINIDANLLISNPNIRVLAVGARLSEKIIITSSNNFSIKKEFNKSITSTKIKNNGLGHKFNLTLKVPEIYKDIQIDMENKVFSVYHLLHFDTSVEINGSKHNLVTSLSVPIVSEESLREANSLPEYS
ncbi:hypothetical protein BB558_001020 [Smittium angustum]|uniref:Arrestin-like N-terminal domain-containing protein n=1 Tax=Smittium angustum TaxID=133377 RepID=A0A2U1JCL8_SMIAN|nr:hypothetical protein BB558_001020 [Smittium angustum]